jgi:predicted dehydrogenase
MNASDHLMSRRSFVNAAALGAGTLAQFPAVLRGAESDRTLKLGLIGCGWYGLVDVEAAFKVGGVEVVALCDVDSAHLEAAAARVEKLQGRRPPTFKQYEELLNLPGLDAVIIATPPHWHALQLIAAVERKLDVYCEKPLAYDIRECRAMADAVKKSGRIVQVGFQRRQSPAFQAVRAYLKEGKAGRIVCADANIHFTAGTKDATPQPPPASLDWDLWCGPAPKIPYSPQVGHMNWRLERTTGHGHLVDWGIHLIDAARVILGEGMPQSVSASGGLYALQGKITTPDVFTAQFDFASCPLTWRHRLWGAAEYTPEVSNGLFFYGENETVFVTDDRWVVIPKDKNAERQVNKVSGDAGKQHMAEFLGAVRSRQQPGCVIEEGLRSTATVKLAMIAYETGSKVVWDAAREEIVGSPAAAALLKREYRAPWVHPFRS